MRTDEPLHRSCPICEASCRLVLRIDPEHPPTAFGSRRAAITMDPFPKVVSSRLMYAVAVRQQPPSGTSAANGIPVEVRSA